MSNQASVAPKFFYLKLGQSKKFTYSDHDIVVTYLSSFPKQIVVVVVDNTEKTFERDLNASPRGIYWRYNNLIFAIKPVVWEFRDGQKIPIYEKTWNTTEIYFEVRLTEVEN
uniref:Uncharacterized protein n=1 Tax=Geoglobus ahangari TaxID=113653 RepID=A0A7C3UCZ2_9EURY